MRHDIAAIKALTPQVLHDTAVRSIQVHAAAATTDELPLAETFSGAMILGLADGPPEVQRMTVAGTLLKRGRPDEGMWPTGCLPARQERARAKCAAHLSEEVGIR